MGFEDLLSKLRTEYRAALVKQGRREAFDRLVEAWSAELGAISIRRVTLTHGSDPFHRTR